MAKEQVLMVLVDVNGGTARKVTIKPSLDEYYRLIGCDTIDMVDRRLGTNRSHQDFTIICDDEGLMSDDPKISAIDNLGKAMLVGNLLVTKCNEEGETVGLTEQEADFVMDRVVHLATRMHPEGYEMLTQCEYC